MQNPVIEYAVQNYERSQGLAISLGARPEEAADCVHDAIVRVLKAPETAYTNVPAYWSRCVKTAAATLWRKQCNRKDGEPREIVSDDLVASLDGVSPYDNPEEEALMGELDARVEQLLAALPVAEGTSMRRKVNDLPYRSVTDRVNVHRARKKLRLALA